MLVASVYMFAACTNNTQAKEVATEEHSHEGCDHNHEHEGQEEITADTTAVATACCGDHAEGVKCADHKDGEKCQHADAKKCTDAEKAECAKKCEVKEGEAKTCCDAKK